MSEQPFWKEERGFFVFVKSIEFGDVFDATKEVGKQVSGHKTIMCYLPNERPRLSFTGAEAIDEQGWKHQTCQLWVPCVDDPICLDVKFSFNPRTGVFNISSDNPCQSYQIRDIVRDQPKPMWVSGFGLDFAYYVPPPPKKRRKNRKS